MMKSFSRCWLLEKWEDTMMSKTWNLETASEKQISICAPSPSLLRFCSHPGLLGSM